MTQQKSYKELDVWIKARGLVKEIYIITSNFPKEEQYSLAIQLKRCAISIPSNIAEGCGRQYKKETLHFLHIARGSLYELETQLYLAFDLDYITNEKLDALLSKMEETRKLLSGFMNYFESNSILK